MNPRAIYLRRKRGERCRPFRRYAVPVVLIAKFIPGLTSAIPPLAGISGIARTRFLLYDGAGGLLWAGSWSGLGYVFSDAIGAAAAVASGLATTLGLVILAAGAAYLLVKHIPWSWRAARAWMARLAPQPAQSLTRMGIHADSAGHRDETIGVFRSGGTPVCRCSARSL